MESIHYFIHHPEDQDRFVKGLIDIFQTNPNKKWFFIRYWHGGPHIRVRFEDDKLIPAQLETLLHNSIMNKEYQLTKESYYKNHSFDGKKEDINQLPFYKSGQVERIKYEPEYERYGKGKLLELSELGFQASSEIVSRFLKMTVNPKAKMAMSVFMFKFFLSHVSNPKEFLKVYHQYWSQIGYSDMELSLGAIESIEEVLKKMELEKVFNAELTKLSGYLQEIKNLLDQSETYEYIISSHIHMTNNRISVVPKLEALIAKAILENKEAGYVA